MGVRAGPARQGLVAMAPNLRRRPDSGLYVIALIDDMERPAKRERAGRPEVLIVGLMRYADSIFGLPQTPCQRPAAVLSVGPVQSGAARSVRAPDDPLPSNSDLTRRPTTMTDHPTPTADPTAADAHYDRPPRARRVDASG
jgi:hypothetical protein